MSEHLPDLIFFAGVGHFGLLIAVALVPFQLDWRGELASMPRLLRQMHWTYGGFIAMTIVAFGILALTCAEELASGSRLARGLCGFVAVFWTARVALQPVLDAKPYLTKWWLRLGYHTLTVLFAYFALVFAAAALV